MFYVDLEQVNITNWFSFLSFFVDDASCGNLNMGVLCIVKVNDSGCV